MEHKEKSKMEKPEEFGVMRGRVREEQKTMKIR
jgi:hypothetical protein